MPHRRLAPFLALLTFVVLPLETLAYVRSTTSNTGSPLVWMKSKCIFVRINSKGSDDIQDGSDVTAARKAIQNWRDGIRACSYLQFVELDSIPDVLQGFTKSGNENVITWVEKDWKHENMAAAITTVFFLDSGSSAGRILDADIELNGQVFHFSTSGNPLRTDVENTVTHELGHMMGLDHPCDDGARTPVPKDHTGTVVPKCGVVQSSTDPKHIAIRETTMFNFADPGETKKRTPEADDIQGICDIYPIAKAPSDCAPVSYEGDGEGCAVASGEPPSAVLMWLLLLGLVLAVKRRRSTAID